MRKLDGDQVLQLRKEHPELTWDELGYELAVVNHRTSKDGQVIPYQYNALRNAIRRVKEKKGNVL